MSGSLLIDAPHVVYSGAACAHCFQVPSPGTLLRCSACDHAWYCDRDCQRAHFKVHKPFCKALRAFRELQSDLPESIWPRDARSFYVQRSNCRQVLEPLLRRPLDRSEQRALLGEAKCSVCMRTRSQLARAGSSGGGTLECCPRCQWGWACTEHRSTYLGGPHANVCETYQVMNSSQLLAPQLAQGGKIPNWCPDSGPTWQGPDNPHSAASAIRTALPEGGWDAYAAWRPTPVFPSSMRCFLSRRWSQALTAVRALQHHYASSSSGVSPHSLEPMPGGRTGTETDSTFPGSPTHESRAASAGAPSGLPPANRLPLPADGALEVHVIGAGGFEAPADLIWEEVLNLIPAAKRLHVAFVGPELGDVILEGSNHTILPQGSALADKPSAATQAGPRLAYSYHLCTYQEWAAMAVSTGCAMAADDGLLQGASASSADAPTSGAPCQAAWRRPHLALAFNSGLSDVDQDLWAPTLELLMAEQVPVAFTSYNAEEAAADAAAWVAAGGTVTQGPQPNPYRCMEPIPEPALVDVFYYHNGWVFHGRGAKRVQQ